MGKRGQNPSPGTVIHNREGSHRSRAFPWGVRGLWHTWGTPTLGASPIQKCLALETNGAYVQEALSAVESWDSSFDGLAHGLNRTRTQCKDSSFRVTGLYVQEIHSLTCKCLPKRPGPMRSLRQRPW